MYQEERLFKIIELLADKKTLSYQEIMQYFGISRDTARRDILKLTEDGSVIRTHGGITSLPKHQEIKGYKERATLNGAKKNILAIHAAQYLTPNQVCFFDVSTTIQCLCQHVPDNIIAYTQSLDNLETLSNRNCPVQMFGGKLHKKNRFIYGSETLMQIDNIHFDIAFIGAASVKADGIYAANHEDACMKRKVAERTTFICILADDSKFSTNGQFKALQFHQVNLFLTTAALPEYIADSLKKAGTLFEIITKGGT